MTFDPTDNLPLAFCQPDADDGPPDSDPGSRIARCCFFLLAFVFFVYMVSLCYVHFSDGPVRLEATDAPNRPDDWSIRIAVMESYNVPAFASE